MNFGMLAKLVLIALVTLLSALPALAANITVDDDCSLINAIREAEEAAQVSPKNNCQAGDNGSGTAGEDIIFLPRNATIELDATLPEITTHIRIRGNGSTISGMDQRRIFSSSTGGQLWANNITLTNGRITGTTTPKGGAIRINAGKMTLEDCVIKDSQAEETGGGINIAQGILEITRCAIHGNTSSNNSGGGIHIETTGGQTQGLTTTVTINQSAIYNNRASVAGGGINLQSTAPQNITVMINNSSIYGNSSSHSSSSSGGGIQISHDNATLTLNHVTITGNTIARSSFPEAYGPGLLVVRGTLVMRNSIVVGNAATNGTKGNCWFDSTATAPNSNFVGNIVGPNGSLGTKCPAAGIALEDLNLADSPTGHPPYYALPADSSAVDAVDCLAGLSDDQRNQARPYGDKCDVGAYEYAPPPPPRGPDRPTGGDGDGGGSSGAEAMPTAVAVIRYSPEQSCQTLQPAIVVSKASSGTSCQRVEGSGIGHEAVIAAMPSLVVDIWGWVTPGTQVCFRAGSGAIKFIDTTAMPRTVADLSVFSQPGGLLCATVDGAGQVALVPGPPAPVATAISPAYQSLSGCMVLLQYSLNFRDAPAGDQIGVLPSQVRLTALERTDGWFKVDYHGERGWISANYVEPEGTCG